MPNEPDTFLFEICGIAAGIVFLILSIFGARDRRYPKESPFRHDLRKVRLYSILAYVFLWFGYALPFFKDSSFLDILLSLFAPLVRYLSPLLCWNILLHVQQKKELALRKKQEEAEILEALRTAEAAEENKIEA
ncbi:MAG: hypothetical protein IJP07_01140 [Firmicutes bacterium]|nr:hypothetical protein [Bacillota bacterium]